jgi:hypothetical protein
MKKAVTSVIEQEHGDTSGTAYLSYLQTIAERSAPDLSTAALSTPLAGWPLRRGSMDWVAYQGRE